MEKYKHKSTEAIGNLNATPLFEVCAGTASLTAHVLLIDKNSFTASIAHAIGIRLSICQGWHGQALKDSAARYNIGRPVVFYKHPCKAGWI
eukprot:132467-Pelagomonas_calceolata.AAC.5